MEKLSVSVRFESESELPTWFELRQEVDDRGNVSSSREGQAAESGGEHAVTSQSGLDGRTSAWGGSAAPCCSHTDRPSSTPLKTEP